MAPRSNSSGADHKGREEGQGELHCIGLTWSAETWLEYPTGKCMHVYSRVRGCMYMIIIQFGIHSQTNGGDVHKSSACAAIKLA